MAHESHAPNLAFERAKAGPNLDSMVSQQTHANRRFINTLWNSNRVELPKLMPLL